MGTELEDAVAMWRQTCAAPINPALQRSPTADRPVVANIELGRIARLLGVTAEDDWEPLLLQADAICREQAIRIEIEILSHLDDITRKWTFPRPAVRQARESSDSTFNNE